MQKRLSAIIPQHQENSKTRPKLKLDTTTTTNDVTFRVEVESPACDKEDAVSRFLNMTLDQIPEKENQENMAAYHYEPNDVYEV